MTGMDVCIIIGLMVAWTIIHNTIGESIREAWRNSRRRP